MGHEAVDHQQEHFDRRLGYDRSLSAREKLGFAMLLPALASVAGAASTGESQPRPEEPEL